MTLRGDQKLGGLVHDFLKKPGRRLDQDEKTCITARGGKNIEGITRGKDRDGAFAEGYRRGGIRGASFSEGNGDMGGVLLGKEYLSRLR